MHSPDEREYREAFAQRDMERLHSQFDKKPEASQIDFIKKCVPYADGFEIEEDFFLKTPFEITYNLRFLDTQPEKFTKGIIPHLLTRTIEGINRTDSDWTIWTNQHFKKIYANWKDGNNTRSQQYPIGEDIDKAKLAALEYIFKQEKEVI